jgi:alpha 1,3-glucosidase
MLLSIRLNLIDCREPYTTLIRDAIRVRYALLPYFYTLFREASVTGTPVMHPLWMEFPDEEMTFSLDKECMIGSSLLVHGVYKEVRP